MATLSAVTPPAGAAATPPANPVMDAATAKAGRRLIPFLILMYMMAFLDRANVSVAKQALAADVQISETMFALGAGIFFVSYAVLEVPSNLILHRVGARVWLARIMVTWGLVAAATMFVKGDTSFIAVRLLLGATEAGFFPGVILYLTYWFPPKARGRMLGLFYFGYPLAMTFGSPLSGLLLKLQGFGGLAGWQWMFLIEGLMAAIVGVLTLVFLPNRPRDVAWLSDAEKDAIEGLLKQEAREKHEEGRGHFLGALRDIRLVHLTAIYFLMQIGSYGVVFFLPDQVSTLLGVKIGPKVGAVSALPWLSAIVLTAILPPISARLNRPRLCMALCMVLCSFGLIASAHAPPVLAIMALCCAAAGIIAAQPLFWVFPTDRFGGTGAAGGIALINALGNLGGFVAPNLRAAADGFFNSKAAGLHAVGSATILAFLLVLLLPARGRRMAAPPHP